MSLDRSLKTRSGMSQARSVLTRAERMAKLTELKRMDAKSPKAIGLPKTRVK
ncbi:MAG: small basic protein [Phycisphaerales bacterium]